jgi:hypothetical protein
MQCYTKFCWEINAIKLCRLVSCIEINEAVMWPQVSIILAVLHIYFLLDAHISYKKKLVTLFWISIVPSAKIVAN